MPQISLISGLAPGFGRRLAERSNINVQVPDRISVHVISKVELATPFGVIRKKIAIENGAIAGQRRRRRFEIDVRSGRISVRVIDAGTRVETRRSALIEHPRPIGRDVVVPVAESRFERAVHTVGGRRRRSRSNAAASRTKTNVVNRDITVENRRLKVSRSTSPSDFIVNIGDVLGEIVTSTVPTIALITMLLPKLRRPVGSHEPDGQLADRLTVHVIAIANGAGEKITGRMRRRSEKRTEQIGVIVRDARTRRFDVEIVTDFRAGRVIELGSRVHRRRRAAIDQPVEAVVSGLAVAETEAVFPVASCRIAGAESGIFVRAVETVFIVVAEILNSNAFERYRARYLIFGTILTGRLLARIAVEKFDVVDGDVAGNAAGVSHVDRHFEVGSRADVADRFVPRIAAIGVVRDEGLRVRSCHANGERADVHSVHVVEDTNLTKRTGDTVRLAR